ncbi:MAG TPA: hypothetical protein VLN49_05135 [Gemmatimonadaceae bacterium]|nr:hypothetical protein [Gemmatimonadaceae bacterium]
MRVRIALIIAVALGATACDSQPTAPAGDHPAQRRTAATSGKANHDALYGGPSNQCYGSIVLGIARTWPWTTDGWVEWPWTYQYGADYAPPAGSVELWIQTYGDEYGITSVRQLQLRFCGA